MGNSQNSEKPLVFSWHAASLEQLAAVTIAVEVLKRRCLQNRSYDASEYHLGMKYHKPVTAAELRYDWVPEIYLEIITKVLEPVAKAWNRWIGANCDNFKSLRGGKYVLIDLMEDVVWTPEIIIDCKGTAEKLMHSCKLDPVDKFCILAEYCCEKELELIWSKFTEEEKEEASKLDKACYPLAFYWYDVLSKRSGEVSVRDVECMKRIINEHPNALAYYWNSFSEKQVEVLFSILWFQDERSLLLILSKLTRPQLKPLMLMRGDLIICRLAEQPNLLKYTVQTWKKICKNISQNSFLEILSKFGNINEDEEYCNNLLFEIWTNAPKYLKKSLGSAQFGRIYRIDSKNTNFRILKGLKRDIRFLADVLSTFSSQWRKWYWKTNWRDLIVGTHPSKLEKLMELCLEDGVADFKADMINQTFVTEYCRTLFHQGLWKELERFLKFCCSGEPSAVKFLKREIFETSELSNLKLDKFDNSKEVREHLSDLDFFMRNVYDENDYIRNKYIFMASPRSIFCVDRNAFVKKYNLFIEFIQHFVSNSSTLLEFKLRFFERSGHSMTNESKMANDQKLSQKQCSSKGHDSKRFKRSTPLLEVLLEMLEVINEQIDYQMPIHTEQDAAEILCMLICFEINLFALWYVDTTEDMDSKSTRLDCYNIPCVLKEALKQNREFFVELIYSWFFNFNRDEIKSIQVAMKGSKVFDE